MLQDKVEISANPGRDLKSDGCFVLMQEIWSEPSTNLSAASCVQMYGEPYVVHHRIMEISLFSSNTLANELDNKYMRPSIRGSTLHAIATCMITTIDRQIDSLSISYFSGTKEENEETGGKTWFFETGTSEHHRRQLMIFRLLLERFQTSLADNIISTTISAIAYRRERLPLADRKSRQWRPVTQFFVMFSLISKCLEDAINGGIRSVKRFLNLFCMSIYVLYGSFHK